MPALLCLIELPDPTRRELEKRFRLHWLPDSHDERAACVSSIANDCRAIVTGYGGEIGEDLLDELPYATLIACFTAGQDMVDLKAAEERGIRVTNNSRALASSVADLAMALLLDLARDVSGADRYVRAGAWSQARYASGRLLETRRMGIFGLGEVGRRIGRRARGFDMEVGYHARRRQEDAEWTYFASLNDLARWSDVLVVCVPGTAETQGLIDCKILEALGPDGWLINVARGSVLDEQALLTALRHKSIAGAGLDVFLNEPEISTAFMGLSNVVLSPHQGSNTIEALHIRTEHLLQTLVEHHAR